MKAILIIVLLCLIGSGSAQNTGDDVLLIWPYGKYYDWNNFESKYLAVKISDSRLLIDTTYNLKSDHFTVYISEPASDYPALNRFLNKPLSEYNYIESMMDEKECDNLSPFYIQYKGGKRVELVHFKRMNECYSSHDGNLNGLYEELQVLRHKYLP